MGYRQTWHKVSSGEGNLSLFNKIKVPMGDNCEIAKIHWRNLNLPRTTVPISTRIQICLNEGSRPFSGGDNYEIAKIHWQISNSSSSEPLRQFQPNLAQSTFGWRGFKIHFHGDIFRK